MAAISRIVTRKNLHKSLAATLFILFAQPLAQAQFSPGELSSAHQHLSGMNNCMQCHEASKVISGAKCLSCHADIQSSIDAKAGYHFRVSSQKCVSCHREHQGRQWRISAFNEQTFDHAMTGFTRIGKHASAECNSCHTLKKIIDKTLLEKVRASGRQTYRGLSQSCISCHPDNHNNAVGRECQTCHTPFGWEQIPTFDHSKTPFALVGKHTTVACAKCHQEIERKEKGKPILFTAKPYDDCSPCHGSPHRNMLAGRHCASCHTPADWRTPRGGARFNHDLAAFKLTGRHTDVACDKCHKAGAFSRAKVTGTSVSRKCASCHADYHRGDFTARFNGECERCHTTAGFSPSTFQIAAHSSSRFPLSGAHLATPCGQCHAKGPDGRRIFQFASRLCQGCHKDRHEGRFAREMRNRSCDACHTPRDWSPVNFDHSRTGFVLVGKHASSGCSSCHMRREASGKSSMQYNGTPTRCESCHKELHNAQFASGGRTDCSRCHQPAGWSVLTFDHSRQSAFALTGAHKRVQCKECHHLERPGTVPFVRFRPLSTKCESCHASGSVTIRG
jgi:hypothetical protein